MCSSGRRQAASPASDADAPSRVSTCRRLTASGGLGGALGELALAEGPRLGAPLELRRGCASAVRLTGGTPSSRREGGPGRSSASWRALASGSRAGFQRHVGDLRERPQVRLGVAVAVEAPAHAQRLGLLHDLHLLDVAVAAHAADPGAHVGAVVEVGVLPELVHPHPAHGGAGPGALADRARAAALSRLHHAVAVHAGLGRRDVGDRRAPRPRRGSSGSRSAGHRRAACGCRAPAGRAGSRRR